MKLVKLIPLFAFIIILQSIIVMSKSDRKESGNIFATPEYICCKRHTGTLVWTTKGECSRSNGTVSIISNEKDCNKEVTMLANKMLKERGLIGKGKDKGKNKGKDKGKDKGKKH